MSKKKYPVNPDFAHYPAMPFPFNGILVALLNKFLHFDTWRTQRAVKAKAIKHQIPTSDGAVIEVLQFNPDKNSSADLPAIAYYHGGAFALTYASTHIAAMDWYANQVGCRVFLVDYRLMPKHLFPTGFNDCYDALVWLNKNAKSLAVNPEKIVVAGDSAGGAMSAAVCQRSKDENGPSIAGQLLIYPVTDSSCSTPSAKEMIGTPLFDAVANKQMWQIYLKSVTNKMPKYASPIDYQDFSGLPAAYVENAEFDPLRDEGANYAIALMNAGVDVVLHETKGTIHGYDTVLDSEITKESLAKRLAFLSSIFN